MKRRTCHPIYRHPFTDGAAVTAVEYHLLIEAALNDGIAGIYRVNKAIGESHTRAMMAVYHPN
jgi:hypothetical protein